MMPDQTSEKAEVKMYSDFKSPYAYLAFDPGMALGERFHVRVRWIPFQLRLKGKGERSVYSEYKVKYSYMDARRWAKPRGLWIRGPLKIYDTTPAAIGGLFAETHGRLLEFGRMAFKKFFLRELEADQPEAVGSANCGSWPLRPTLFRISRRQRPRGIRTLPARGGRGPRVRRSFLPVRGRAVLGLRPACAARTAADGVWSRNWRQGYGSLTALGRHKPPSRSRPVRFSFSTQREVNERQNANAYGLSRARHHSVRRGPDLHADNGRAGRRGHQAGAGAIRRSRPRLRRQAARREIRDELAKHLLLPAQSLEKKPCHRYQAHARP